MNKHIEQWLNGPQDFQEGCALLAKYSPSSATLMLIFKRSGATSYNCAKLVEELQRVAEKAKHQPGVDTPQSAKTSQALPSKEASQSGERPDRKSDYDPRLLALIRERSHYHAQLTAVATEAQRMALAFSILDLTDRIEIMLGVKEVMPEASPREIPTDRAAMVKMLQNNRSYISRYKDSPLKASMVQARIAENQILLNKLNHE